MHFSRDNYIRLGVRQLNWLRLEHYKRISFSSLVWKNLILKSLISDSTLNFQTKVFVYQRLVFLSKKSRISKHNSRCWFSGRSRQVSRKFLLARMHYRAALASGSLPLRSVLRF